MCRSYLWVEKMSKIATWTAEKFIRFMKIVMSKYVKEQYLLFCTIFSNKSVPVVWLSTEIVMDQDKLRERGICSLIEESVPLSECKSNHSLVWNQILAPFGLIESRGVARLTEERTKWTHGKAITHRHLSLQWGISQQTTHFLIHGAFTLAD